MRLVAYRTFKIVRFKDMVVVRIKFKSLVHVGSLGNRIPRIMIFARNAGFRRRCRFGFGFAVVTDIARYAAILVPIRRGLLFLRLLTCRRSNDQQSGYS